MDEKFYVEPNGSLRNISWKDDDDDDDNDDDYQFWNRQLIMFQNKHFVIEQLEPKEKPSGGIKLFGLCR